MVREKENGSEARKDGKLCEGMACHADFCFMSSPKQSGSLGSWIHSAPETFLSGLHRALCLQAVVHGKSLSAQIYWFLLAKVHPTGSKLSCISKFHHLDPLMAAQDASSQALQYSVSFKPRSMRCQTSRYVAGWLAQFCNSDQMEGTGTN